VRKADELPWQRLQAQQWDQLNALLCDLKFVEAKCGAGMTYELAQDYESALDALPEHRERRAEERRREERLQRYCEELVRYAAASGQGVTFPAPPDSRKTQQQMKQAELRDLAVEKKRIDSIYRRRAGQRDVENLLPSQVIEFFAGFVSTQGYSLARFPAETIPIARNYARSGPVVVQAEQLFESSRRIRVFRDPRPPVAVQPLCVRTLELHLGDKDAMAMTPDGKTAITIGRDHALLVWDLPSRSRRMVTSLSWPVGIRTCECGTGRMT
jgi:hypothetical protein